MGFNIKLDRRCRPLPGSLREYDPDLDSEEALLSEVCSGLADSDAVIFTVGGFGEETWPVDVRTDLPIVLEQLPKLAASLVERREGQLELYEQGIERTLIFHPIRNEVRVTCLSQTSWRPVPEVVVEHRAHVITMLMEVCDVFWRAALEMTPDVADHPCLREWKRRVYALRKTFD